MNNLLKLYILVIWEATTLIFQDKRNLNGQTQFNKIWLSPTIQTIK